MSTIAPLPIWTKTSRCLENIWSAAKIWSGKFSRNEKRTTHTQQNVTVACSSNGQELECISISLEWNTCSTRNYILVACGDLFLHSTQDPQDYSNEPLRLALDQLESRISFNYAFFFFGKWHFNSAFFFFGKWQKITLLSRGFWQKIALFPRKMTRLLCFFFGIKIEITLFSFSFRQLLWVSINRRNEKYKTT